MHTNRRLKKETGELLFEKRDHKWTLTRFAFNVYGCTGFEEISFESGSRL